MSVGAEQQVIAAIASQPGQPVGMIRAGSVVPLQVARHRHEVYPTYEALAAEVLRTTGEALYCNAEGRWVRVVREHTGVTEDRRQPDGTVVTFAARVEKERAVALSMKEAQTAESLSDYFSRGKGWIRNGQKREWEEPENLGSRSTESVTWEHQESRQPLPQDRQATTDTVAASLQAVLDGLIARQVPAAPPADVVPQAEGTAPSKGKTGEQQNG